METLPDDLIEEIYLRAPQTEWSSLMQTNRLFLDIFQKRIYPALSDKILDDKDLIDHIDNEDIWTIYKALEEGKVFDWNRALNKAAYIGNRELVDLMIQKGANSFDEALENAIYGGHEHLIEYLLSFQVEVADSSAPLAAAAFTGRADLVRSLLSGSLDLTYAYLYASNRGYSYILDILAKSPYHDPPNPVILDMALEQAVEGNQLRAINKLVKLGADLESLNRALVKAAWLGHIEIVRRLLVLGATDYQGAISSALSKNDARVVELIQAWATAH